jgi:ethanolamine utilization protein EutJ
MSDLSRDLEHPEGMMAPELLLAAAAARMGNGPAAHIAPGPLRVGVDLGTATTVLVVLDAEGAPVWVGSRRAMAVRDGVVVDFHGAVCAVRELRDQAQEELGLELFTAAAAAPPGVPAAEAQACRHVCESVGFEDVTLTDEVTAAHLVLDVSDGVLVDVGGGSTGVGVYRDGQLVALDDRAGGGHHMDLVLAGALGIAVDQAERFKRDRPEDALDVLIPAIERVAESIRIMTSGASDLDVYVVGGGLMMPGACDVVARYLGRRVHNFPHPFLVTPLGIARSAQ